MSLGIHRPSIPDGHIHPEFLLRCGIDSMGRPRYLSENMIAPKDTFPQHIAPEPFLAGIADPPECNRNMARRHHRGLSAPHIFRPSLYIAGRIHQTSIALGLYKTLSFHTDGKVCYRLFAERIFDPKNTSLDIRRLEALATRRDPLLP